MVKSVKSRAAKPVKFHLVKSDLGRHVARRVRVTGPRRRRVRARARQRPPHTCRYAAVGHVRVTSASRPHHVCITPVLRPCHARVTSFGVSRPCLARCLLGNENVQCRRHAGVTPASRRRDSASRPCQVPQCPIRVHVRSASGPCHVRVTSLGVVTSASRRYRVRDSVGWRALAAPPDKLSKELKLS